MTQVRVRHTDDGRSQLLGDIELSDAALTEAINILKRWGVRNDALEGQYFTSTEFSGEFVYNDGSIYFEIVGE